jgi:hypothetical protein
MADSVEDPTAEMPVAAPRPPAVAPTPVAPAAPTADRRARAAREPRRWSGLPIAASLALVAFAIVFGVYGPRVVDRGSPSVGTPLWEVVDTVVEHFDRFVSHASFRTADAIDTEAASKAMSELLHQAFTCPDLTGVEFAPIEPQMLRLPGASRSGATIYTRMAKDGLEYLCLAVAPYAEQYTMFSEFGRPELLPMGGAITFDAAPSDRIHASALIWTDGAFLYVAIGSRRTTLPDVTPALAPAMSVDAP